MQDRLTTALAVNDAVTTRLAAAKMVRKVDEASQAFTSLKNKIVTKSISPPGTNELAFNASTPVLDLAELDKVEQLLNEAKGMYAGVER